MHTHIAAAEKSSQAQALCEIRVLFSIRGCHPLRRSLFRTGMICVIFVRSAVRIRFPPGRLRKSRKRAFLSLDAELIFMKVDALTAEKVVS